MHGDNKKLNRFKHVSLLCISTLLIYAINPSIQNFKMAIIYKNNKELIDNMLNFALLSYLIMNHKFGFTIAMRFQFIAN
ncbi:unnamed protein product [Blepharisma stoltei]|uniref:Uncharacterized protein n=1 Tax=Blepharisma stoltei TaxID=1481888 RepID=A0AAU9KDZ8_9CILI|nr:unnamed protein product [Blepharisma stoltei]